VTGCGKTLHVHTIIEHHPNTVTIYVAVDNQVCFYRWPFCQFYQVMKCQTDPVGPLRGINRVAWHPKLLHWMSTQLMLWSGATVCLFSLLGTQFGWLCLPSVLTYPHPLYMALVILLAVFKMSLKTSQSNQ